MGNKRSILWLQGINLKKVKEFNFFERYKSVGTDLSLLFLEKGYKFINIDIKSSQRSGNSKFGNMLLGNYKIFKSIFLVYFFINDEKFL